MTAPALPAEIIMPFAVDSLGRIGFSVDPYAQIDSHLQLLILSSVHERLMLPDYGCSTKSYVFRPLDDGLTQLLELEITQAIANYEPLINVQEVAISYDTTEGTMSVTVSYVLVAAASQGAVNVFSATINEGGTVVSTS